MLQTITTSGTGASSSTQEVVRGIWRISYRAFTSGDLPASESSAAVQTALQSLGAGHITVTKSGSGALGWSWRVVFFDPASMAYPISVHGQQLYTTNGDASISVTSSSSLTSSPPSLINDTAFATYSTSELSSYLGLSLLPNVLGTGSYAYYMDESTLRILPSGFSAVTSRLSQLIGSLQLQSIGALPTADGRLYSIGAAPILSL